MKQEIERRLQEKEEEFEATKKNYQRTIDSLQVSLLLLNGIKLFYSCWRLLEIASNKSNCQ